MAESCVASGRPNEHVLFDVDETMVILAGRMTIETEDGLRHELERGSVAFFPQGRSADDVPERTRRAFHAASDVRQEYPDR